MPPQIVVLSYRVTVYWRLLKTPHVKSYGTLAVALDVYNSFKRNTLKVRSVELSVVLQCDTTSEGN